MHGLIAPDDIAAGARITLIASYVVHALDYEVSV